MFKLLAVPINEQHKLCIIEENMLPKYAIAVAAIEITSLRQLANICRRTDYADEKNSARVSQNERAHNTRTQSRPSSGGLRELQEVDAVYSCVGNDDGFSGFENTPGHDREVAEIRRSNNRDEAKVPNVERRKCFNCLREGHNFSECTVAKTGQFCYRCGSRDVTTFTCQKCPKNGPTGSAPSSGAQNQQRKQ